MIFIPPKDSEHCIINFFDTKTGENLGHVEDIEEVNMTHFSETEEEHNKHGDINWSVQEGDHYTDFVNYEEARDYYLKAIGE